LSFAYAGTLPPSDFPASIKIDHRIDTPFNSHQAWHYSVISNTSTTFARGHHSQRRSLPEEPPSMSRLLTTMRTLANFTIQFVIAILIGQFKTSIGIEILNHEIKVLVLTTRTHGFQLAGCVAAG
jgi:hypothetical protein